jgi:two-component system, NarL family, nitrate/nitrite response regulator NarL
MRSSERSRTPIRIVVADDHPVFREGLIRLLETQPELQVVGAGADGDDAMKLVAELQPDLLLLDVAMPRMSGLAALKALRDGGAHVRVILVTASIERADMVAGLQLGAQGVVVKASASEVLFKSIRAVMAGEYWVGPSRVSDLPTALRGLADPPSGVARKQFGLTPRELEIIAVILGGFSNSEIAIRFSISEKTVKHHLTNVFDKLGVSNRLELALFALHHKLAVEPGPADMATATRRVMVEAGGFAPPSEDVRPKACYVA